MTAPLRSVVPYMYEAAIPYAAPMNTAAWRRHWSAAKRERVDGSQLVLSLGVVE